MTKKLTAAQRKALLALWNRTSGSSNTLAALPSTMEVLRVAGFAENKTGIQSQIEPRWHRWEITPAGAAEARRIRDERAS